MEVLKYRLNNIYHRSNPAFGRTFLIFGIVLLLLGTSFPAIAQTTPDELPADNGNYKIGAGDVLSVMVLKQTILTQDALRVSNEGTIRMPMLDEPISAACRTEAQLSTEIANRYKRLILNPQVYVTVKEFKANPVAVIGAVNSPKSFQLQRPTRLFQILSEVNGPSPNAGQFIQIFRDRNLKRCEETPIETLQGSSGNGVTDRDVISLPLSALMGGGDDANPYILGGDIVRVTEAEVKQAYVIGNVKSAMTINLKEPVSLSRAIAMAGGFSQGAQTDKIKISRQNPLDLSKSEILVNLKNKKGEAQSDILLQPNDVVDVPGPKPSLWKDILRGIIPSVMRVPMLP